MELRVHDIIRLDDDRQLIGNLPRPNWVSEALKCAPYVVVRRESMSNGMIPVGVRGNRRNERYATYLPIHAIVEHITPEWLAATSIWDAHARFQQMKVLQALPQIECIFTGLNLRWGPAGSVGFELASGYPAINDESDLDLILRVDQPPTLEVAKRMLHMLDQISVRTDVQIESPTGAVALAEYAQGNSFVLLRANTGPRFIEIGGYYK